MQNLFGTSDLPLSTTLFVLKFSLTKIEKETTGRVTFYFENSPELQKVVQNFWSRELSIEPQELLMAFKMLKNRIYSL